MNGLKVEDQNEIPKKVVKKNGCDEEDGMY